MDYRHMTENNRKGSIMNDGVHQYSIGYIAWRNSNLYIYIEEINREIPIKHYVNKYIGRCNKKVREAIEATKPSKIEVYRDTVDIYMQNLPHNRGYRVLYTISELDMINWMYDAMSYLMKNRGV